MPEDEYMQFLQGTVTESAASTLTEAAISTGATVGGMSKGEAIALEIKEVIIQMNLPEDDPAANSEEVMGFALSVQSGLAATPSISDVHCIYKTRMILRGGVATYLPMVLHIEGYPLTYQFTNPLLIPYSKIYAYVASTNSATPAVFKYRIGFTYVLLKAEQIIEALEVWRQPVV